MNKIFGTLFLGSLFLSPVFSYAQVVFSTNLKPDRTGVRVPGTIYREWKPAHRYCISKGFDAGAKSYRTKTKVDRIRQTRKITIDKVRCALGQNDLGPAALNTRRAYEREKQQSDYRNMKKRIASGKFRQIAPKSLSKLRPRARR
ncbi:MAG: hypothetical protein GW917_02065 [Bdellovibrionales bacterium]|nr:hypothetical protein [Bdellovibrionales bacterium]